MAKFEIDMEITGFRLKVRGEREEIKNIGEGINQQLTGLIGPALSVAQRRLPVQEIKDVLPPDSDETETASRKRTRRTSTSNIAKTSNGNKGRVALAVDWIHDPGRWGVPRQTWTAQQKILWLLLVVSEAADAKEISGGSICKTFNKHFRQAGILHSQNMPRDLGRLKQATPARVSEHAAETPSKWFLTDEGIKDARGLVNEAKGTTAVES